MTEAVRPTAQEISDWNRTFPTGTGLSRVLLDWVEMYPEEWVLEALEITRYRGVNNPRYTQGVLRNLALERADGKAPPKRTNAASRLMAGEP